MKAVPPDLAERLRTNADAFLALGDDARLDDLAESIGVARATLYYYFSGKDDVTSFFMTEKLERVGRAIAEASGAATGPLERFEVALGVIVEDLCAEPAMCLHLTAAQARPLALAEVVRAMRVEVMAPMREALIEARASGFARVDDPDVVIPAILGAVNRAVLHQYVDGGSVDAARVTRVIRALLLDGLRPRAADPADSA